MPHSSPQSRLRSRPRLLRGVSWLLLATLAAVFSATLWHSHDRSSPHQEDDCAVCAAVMTPTGDGLPELPLFEPPALGELVRWMGAQRFAVLWVGRDRASRGPPAVLA